LEKLKVILKCKQITNKFIKIKIYNFN
jgi:hypothetical protein